MSDFQNTIPVPIEVQILEAASADVTFSEWMNDFSGEDGL
jgi:hypothetical protein